MGSSLGLQPADYGAVARNCSCRGRSISDAAAGCMGLHRIAQSHTGLRVAEGFRRVRGCCWVASNPDWGSMGSERVRPFWAFVWRVYDRPVLVRVLPRVAPWLFGKMIGSVGERKAMD